MNDQEQPRQIADDVAAFTINIAPTFNRDQVLAARKHIGRLMAQVGSGQDVIHLMALHACADYTIEHLKAPSTEPEPEVRQHPWYSPQAEPRFEGCAHHCRDARCPDTNFGGHDRVHYRDDRCLPGPAWSPVCPDCQGLDRWLHVNAVPASVLRLILDVQVLEDGDCGNMWDEYHQGAKGCPRPHLKVKSPTAEHLETLREWGVPYAVNVDLGGGKMVDVETWEWQEFDECPTTIEMRGPLTKVSKVTGHGDNVRNL